ncbi:spore germination protein [Paenibacillus sp. CGMCC 1.16610]|uniref:Spore germination protein n=1 Tax=Paenibacillus anseongense TaxID=2682845 RepID=A0ABW9U2U4_9BACL|nr:MULTISPECIES: spore germination protein [Paenibacillus]MBA2941864.1 spore germination protein [Paenibacillus sp. CGMCC 1.16610]MVQ34382.1 spore germination protein [Paenibacillus anseongense]
MMVSESLSASVKSIMDVIGHNHDVVLREIALGSTGRKAAIIYIATLGNAEVINKSVLQPLMQMKAADEDADSDRFKERVIDTTIVLTELVEDDSVAVCIRNILSGNTVLIVDQISSYIILSTAHLEGRSIEEPKSESVVRGSREGFVENISTNISLIRQRIKDPTFTMLQYHVGKRTERELVIAFIKDIANDQIVEEVCRRIETIDIDDAGDSGFIEQFIEDNTFSPFPQVMNTERPDRVVNALMEGKVAILLDGTPFVLIVPVTFPMMLYSPEDNNERWMYSSLIRMMRYILAFVSLYLPSLYIAFISFHQGLIPTKLAISITSSREGVPFPTFVEAMMMEITIEILREAAIRLPRPIGQAIGMVGGLVIGQSAVQAGIVSPIMVIVVAVTAISSYTIPIYSAGIAMRMLRFFMMFAASMLGLYGIIMVTLLLLSHIMKLKSFGTNYAGVFVHYHPSNWKDSIIKYPLKWIKERPNLIDPKDKKRAN